VSTAAVILAAGEGRRFSGDDPHAAPGAKLLAAIGGRPVVVWAVAPALAAGLDEVVVVEGAADLATVLPPELTLIRNEDWSRGLATSLRAGLDWCARQGHERAVVGLGDTPGLRADAWRAVAAAPGGPIVVATYAGQRGQPVRLDAEVWSRLPGDGDEGARGLARRHPELVFEVACLGDPADIDTPEDLRRWSLHHGTD
jgi:CTP:molybdopterin cytidylyltransferase MocA